MTIRYFEDFQPGEVIELGEKLVTREEIVAFAAEFDPQPFHLDDAAGADSLLGGLAASGWHTIAMLMRLLCDGLLLSSSCMGSPGVDKVAWLLPVRPGDRISARARVVATRALRSRPGLGIVRFDIEVANQDRVTVMTMDNDILFGLRETAA